MSNSPYFYDSKSSNTFNGVFQFIDLTNTNTPLLRGTFYCNQPYNPVEDYISINYLNSPIPLRTYPITINSSTSGIIDALYNAFTPLSVSGTRKGFYKLFSDGYGTLKLGNSVLNNVIRIQLVLDFVDSINYGSNTWGISSISIKTYSWLKQDIKGNLLSLSQYTSSTNSFTNGSITNTFNFSENAAYGNYDSNIVTQIISNPNSDFQHSILVYPNPSQSEINVKSLNGKPIDAISIYSIQGSLIKTINDTGIEKNIQLGEIPKGIYFIKVSLGVENFAQKITLQ